MQNMNNEKKMGSAEKEGQIVTALARGLSVLRSFRQGDRFLGNQEIAELGAERLSVPSVQEAGG